MFKEQVFITKAIKAHNNKYTYRKVYYVNAKTNVIITCPSHGDFEQKPCYHLIGHGCYKCGARSKSSTEEFIQKAKEIHKNKYNYSKVNYTDAKVKVIITCPSHGDFYQTPNSHLTGCGCPRCKTSRGENEIAKLLNDFSIKYETQKKFDSCVYLDYLPFDFFLPDYNTAIEFDGIQHYEPIEFFGGIDGFERRQLHDEIKTEYCRENNIRLHRISYIDNIFDKMTMILHLSVGEGKQS